jgi:DNA invertase Pin-like site-specific DNA recombinase
MSPKRISRPLDIYIRVSDVRGRAGESFISPPEQEDRCRAALASRGLEAGEVFRELDVSGKTKQRPELAKARQRIEDGVSGGIVVARIDRFGRTAARALDAIDEIDKAGGAVITAEGDFDTTTAVGELVLGIMLQLAQFELRRIRENWSAAQRRAVGRGVHVTRHAPPGYRKAADGRLKPDGKHAKTITEAYKLAAKGASPSEVAAYLNERGLPSGDNGATVWQPNRIKRILANRVYLGEARYGSIANPDAHKPLTDLATWTLAQHRSTRQSQGSPNAVHLLAGLSRCAGCTHAMRSQAPRGTTVGTYRCSTTTVHGRCPAPSSVSLGRLDEHVVDQFLARARGLQLRQEAPPDEAVDRLAVVAAEAEASYRQALTNTDLRHQIGAADHDRMVATLHKDWQEALAVIPEPTSAVSETLEDADLAELVAELQRRGDVDSLRELLASAIQAVFVRPAASRARNVPIEDRVRIVWRDDDQLDLPRRGERFEPRAYTW